MIGKDAERGDGSIHQWERGSDFAGRAGSRYVIYNIGLVANHKDAMGILETLSRGHSELGKWLTQQSACLTTIRT